jgi:hypothetical protein
MRASRLSAHEPAAIGGAAADHGWIEHGRWRASLRTESLSENFPRIFHDSLRQVLAMFRPIVTKRPARFSPNSSIISDNLAGAAGED